MKNRLSPCPDQRIVLAILGITPPQTRLISNVRMRIPAATLQRMLLVRSEIS